MVLEVCTLGFRGLAASFPRFARLAFQVCQQAFRGLHAWRSRFANVLSEVCKPVLLRWRASSSPLTGVGGCRAPKGSRGGNAGVVASCLTCGARARPRGSRGIGATRAVRSRRWKNKDALGVEEPGPDHDQLRRESAERGRPSGLESLTCGACPPTRGIAATCAVRGGAVGADVVVGFTPRERQAPLAFLCARATRVVGLRRPCITFGAC